jgi:hypothetical protein
MSSCDRVRKRRRQIPRSICPPSYSDPELLQRDPSLCGLPGRQVFLFGHGRKVLGVPCVRRFRFPSQKFSMQLLRFWEDSERDLESLRNLPSFDFLHGGKRFMLNLPRSYFQ